MSNLGSSARQIADDEGGAALVEFALVMLVFFFLFFSLIDFGRWGSSYVMAEKAAQLAAQTAAVRPPACAGVPERHQRPAAPARTRRGSERLAAKLANWASRCATQ